MRGGGADVAAVEAAAAGRLAGGAFADARGVQLRGGAAEADDGAARAVRDRRHEIGVDAVKRRLQQCDGAAVQRAAAADDAAAREDDARLVGREEAAGRLRRVRPSVRMLCARTPLKCSVDRA